jgi:hypothetical protein
MKIQSSNTLSFSFFSFLENKFTLNAEAYNNLSSKFYYIQDDRIPSTHYRYSSPYKQFVYDRSVTGATIISGISGSFGFLSDGQSGIRIDYDNGSVLVPTGFGKNMQITGSYAVKEFNFYQSNELLESVIEENKYETNSRFKRTASGIAPYTIVMPAAIIAIRYGEKRPIALGGLQSVETYCTCVLVHNDEQYMDAALCTLRDLKDKAFPLIPVEMDPLNQFGGLKSGYSYETLCSQYFTPGNLAHIETVRVSRLSDKFKANPNLYYGIADFKISEIKQV